MDMITELICAFVVCIRFLALRDSTKERAKILQISGYKDTHIHVLTTESQKSHHV